MTPSLTQRRLSAKILLWLSKPVVAEPKGVLLSFCQMPLGEMTYYTPGRIALIAL